MTNPRRTTVWVCLFSLVFVGTSLADEVADILAETGVQGGLVVHLGCGDGRRTAQFGKAGNYLVQGLDANAQQVLEARRYIQSLGLYGDVSIDQITTSQLPYADNLVNLLVVEQLGGVSPKECLRVLAPRGVAYIKSHGKWQKSVKPVPPDIDEWTHHLHDASGNPVARDRVVGPPRHMQWTAGPRWARSHGWTPSVSAMVSSGGRLFYICDETLSGAGNAIPSKWNLVARDAFSGVLLWKQRLERWSSYEISGTPDTGGGISVGRFTMPPHLGKRLVSVGNVVYVTLGATAPVSALDAATGKLLQVYDGTENADEVLFSNGRLIVSINPPAQSRPAIIERTSDPSPAPGKHVGAWDAASGRQLWITGPFPGIRAGRSQDPFGRLELTAAGDKVFLLTARDMVALAADSGQSLWRKKRPDLPDAAVRRLGYSGIYEYQLTVMLHHDGVLLLAQPVPNTHHTYHTMPGTLHAFAAEDGRALWQRPYGGWGHCTQPDVFAVGDTVWSHVHVPTQYGSVWGNGYRAQDSSKVDYRIQALNLHTGEVQREILTKDLFNVGHHHRCYRNKMTERFLMSSRRGVEFVDLESGENTQHHWVRSGCLLGNLPCNGLLYVAPHPCGCYVHAKLTGFNALAPLRSSRSSLPDSSAKNSNRTRLEPGPAYASKPDPNAKSAGDSLWPTYRHDARRSGATSSPVDTNAKLAWQTKVGSSLSAVVVGQGQILVARVDGHCVTALEADAGQPIWSYTAGARIKSPPTLHQGLAIFGAADGCVYCLRASDGALVWRFQAAPRRVSITAFEQLESAWPIPGVMIQDGACWFAAGRSSYLDGGLHVFALEPATGKVIERRVVYSPNPETGAMTPEPDGHNMEGILNDIFSSDGRDIFVRQMNLTSQDGQRTTGQDRVYSTAGFLDSSWFNRTFWRISKAQTTGPMVLGDEVAYGIEPYTARSRDIMIQPGSRAYRLRCLSIRSSADKVADRRGKKAKGRKVPRGPKIVWEQPLEMRPSSLVRAAGTLFVAGSPDVIDPADPAAAWEGRSGGVLAAFAAADGSRLAEWKLTAPPVWDGMAAAGGGLYLPLQDGSVVCLR